MADFGMANDRVKFPYPRKGGTMAGMNPGFAAFLAKKKAGKSAKPDKLTPGDTTDMMKAKPKAKKKMPAMKKAGK